MAHGAIFTRGHPIPAVAHIDPGFAIAALAAALVLASLVVDVLTRTSIQRRVRLLRVRGRQRRA